MRIAMVGAGGVGGLFGGLLARAGEEVVLLARGSHLQAIRRDGLTVDSPLGRFTVRPQASDDPAALGAVDAVVVAVKTWQVKEVAPRLRPLLGPATVVVPMENGVEAAAELQAALGAGPVAGGLCHVMAWIEGPGAVKHAGFGPKVTLGELAGGGSERLERLAAAMRKAGMEAAVVDDIRTALWEKFLFIDPLSSVGAATRAPVGEMLAVPETRALLLATMREVEALARKSGARLAPDAVDRTLKRVESLPADGTASMQRDVLAGRPSELHEQTGAVVRLGRAAQVPVPVHEALYGALLPQERKARAAR
ncbi:MAG TPA: 2-dehydropantoate 2-reductase [Anaeromyxobacteraceae bacterium]|nr:2-dehydropantoate 2-reductase [Anaeromyxobacteraceae bacterium]